MDHADNKCSKKFPKQFQNKTLIDANSSPMYRRQGAGKTYNRPNDYVVNNRFLVPYCPVLSLMFNCHIDVGICLSIQSIKYLHKYICKGHDAASVVITKNASDNVFIERDEIRQFVDT